MNKIKGLILKDLLELRIYKKNFLLTLIIYIILIIANSDNNSMIFFATSMITYLFSIYALATFNYDEKQKTDTFILTFPISKKEIVLSKYILTISSIVLGIISGSIIGISLFLLNIVKVFNIKEYLLYILGITYVLSLIVSIQIPCIYKWGAEKGRTQIYFIALALFAIIGIVTSQFLNININAFEYFIPIIVVMLIIINYYISYKISLKLYLRKEM